MTFGQVTPFLPFAVVIGCIPLAPSALSSYPRKGVVFFFSSTTPFLFVISSLLLLSFVALSLFALFIILRCFFKHCASSLTPTTDCDATFSFEHQALSFYLPPRQFYPSKTLFVYQLHCYIDEVESIIAMSKGIVYWYKCDHLVYHPDKDAENHKKTKLTVEKIAAICELCYGSIRAILENRPAPECVPEPLTADVLAKRFNTDPSAKGFIGLIQRFYARGNHKRFNQPGSDGKDKAGDMLVERVENNVQNPQIAFTTASYPFPEPSCNIPGHEFDIALQRMANDDYACDVPNPNEETIVMVAAIRTGDGTDDGMEDDPVVGVDTMYMMEDIVADMELHAAPNVDVTNEWDAPFNSLNDSDGLNSSYRDVPESVSMEQDQAIVGVDQVTNDTQQPQASMQTGSQSAVPTPVDNDMQSTFDMENTMQATYSNLDFPGTQREPSPMMDTMGETMFDPEHPDPHIQQSTMDINEPNASKFANTGHLVNPCQSFPTGSMHPSAYTLSRFPGGPTRTFPGGAGLVVPSSQPFHPSYYPTTQFGNFPTNTTATSATAGQAFPYLQGPSSFFHNPPARANPSQYYPQNPPLSNANMSSTRSDEEKTQSKPVVQDATSSTPRRFIGPETPPGLRERQRQQEHRPMDPLEALYHQSAQMASSLQASPSIQPTGPSRLRARLSERRPQFGDLPSMNLWSPLYDHITQAAANSQIPLDDRTRNFLAQLRQMSELEAHYERTGFGMRHASNTGTNEGQTVNPHGQRPMGNTSYNQGQRGATSSDQAPTTTSQSQMGTTRYPSVSRMPGDDYDPEKDETEMDTTPFPPVPSTPKNNNTSDQTMTGQSSQPMEQTPQTTTMTSRFQAFSQNQRPQHQFPDRHAPPGPPHTWAEQHGGPSQEPVPQDEINWNSRYEVMLGTIRNDVAPHARAFANQDMNVVRLRGLDPGNYYNQVPSSSEQAQGNTGSGATISHSGPLTGRTESAFASTSAPGSGAAGSPGTSPLSRTWDMSGQVSATPARRRPPTSLRLIDENGRHILTTVPPSSLGLTAEQVAAIIANPPYLERPSNEPRRILRLGGQSREQSELDADRHFAAQLQRWEAAQAQARTQAQVPAPTPAQGQDQGQDPKRCKKTTDKGKGRAKPE